MWAGRAQTVGVIRQERHKKPYVGRGGGEGKGGQGTKIINGGGAGTGQKITDKGFYLNQLEQLEKNVIKNPTSDATIVIA